MTQVTWFLDMAYFRFLFRFVTLHKVFDTTFHRASS